MKFVNRRLAVLILSATVLIGAGRNGAFGSGERLRLIAFQQNGAKGIAIRGAGTASAEQSRAAQIEIYIDESHIDERAAGYTSLRVRKAEADGIARVPGPNGINFDFKDHWTLRGDVLELARTVHVQGSAPGGFLSGVTLSHAKTYTRAEVEYFAPGMIYGGTAHLEKQAIGGADTYETGKGQVQIREDRLPAPMVGVRFADGSALTVLDPAPNGATTREDSHDTSVRTLIDERFRFASIGADLDGGHHTQGVWYPGSEGEVTYRGNTYPGGQEHQWRRRYHPMRDGFLQQYRVSFRFSRDASFPAYFREAWRWAYNALRPADTSLDLSIARRSIVDVLASQVQVRGDRAGIPNAVSAVPGAPQHVSPNAIMGFTGKNLEAAEYLLADADIDSDAAHAERDRKLGLAIFASFVRLKMKPPVGEGFVIETGAPALAIPRDRCVFLRSFGDDMKATLRAYERERKHGREHPEWLAWARGFGDWLLTQQRADGGFPRSWKPGTGEVADASPASSYNPIPFLVLLSRATNETRYLHAAQRAAEFVWTHGQSQGRFAGGTIDNPDVLDKEAGTLSNEAYIALYELTKDAKWLARAQAAANFAETWIYLWNVPMPAGENDAQLHWKRGVPTSGTQLIASGHSLVDDYMAFDVDEYEKLARWTNDAHYHAIARLLLYDTKNMLALPGRTFDLKGPGWQQEHFSFAPVRGFGLHRLWLPWVATSQLDGIFGWLELAKSAAE